MHEQLPSFLLESKALPDDQFGFLRGRSAEWQLLSVVETWHKALDQRHLVHAVFLDAAKAFDRFDHQLLLQSFYSLGVRGISLQWLQSYLDLTGCKATCQNRLIQVCVMDNLSTRFNHKWSSPGLCSWTVAVPRSGPGNSASNMSRSQSNFTVRRRHNGIPRELLW